MDAMLSNHPEARHGDAQRALAGDAGTRRLSSPGSGVPEESPSRPTGYGLPCSKCRLYYPANLNICPTCNSSERVAPQAPRIRPNTSQAAAPIPNSDTLEREREEFLRQFKSQLSATQPVAIPSRETVCTLGEHHPGNPAPAEVCKSCYDRLQERLDVCEAALHIDLKEAAQIVYDAVWADSSDPSKTYQNAASALLAELRKRSGVTTLLGPFQPLTH